MPTNDNGNDNFNDNNECETPHRGVSKQTLNSIR